MSKGGTVVELADFIIDTTNTPYPAPVISGLVIADGKTLARLPLFSAGQPTNFRLPLQLTEGSLLSLTGSNLTLTPQAASALNAAFGVTAFRSGLEVGTANSLVITAS